MMLRWSRLKIITSALIALCAGCGRGDGLTRTVVTGHVTLSGQPVEDGQIRFIPQSGTAGPITIEPIRGGRYVCEEKGGVPVGQHRVEIMAWDPKVPPPRGPGGTPRPQWAPPEFNSNSQLTVSIDEHDAPLTKDFSL